jgi:hypothetical protein
MTNNFHIGLAFLTLALTSWFGLFLAYSYQKLTVDGHTSAKNKYLNLILLIPFGCVIIYSIFTMAYTLLYFFSFSLSSVGFLTAIFLFLIYFSKYRKINISNLYFDANY